MTLRNRGGIWHYRFKLDGKEYSGTTDLAATKRQMSLNIPGFSEVQEKGWRRGSESNRRIKVLQTSPLPLGYRA
jgi:hypothetical protein